MIFGIGTDILEVSRMAQALARQPRMVQRILGPMEQAVYAHRASRSAERGLRYLCMRFAAKEAFSKAAGLGVRTPMTWQAIEVINSPSGAPHIHAHGAMAQWLVTRKLKPFVSMSDEKTHVVAFVVLQTQED
ncbi:MAG: holo-ACP synthase [Burkholderiaceae bacterium]